MAKITRIKGKPIAFASGAAQNERTIFGTTDQSNDLTAQITSDYINGWGFVGPSDAPTLQDFNALGYTSTQLIAYLHQAGIPEYDATQEYFVGSVVQYNGEIYTAKVDNVGIIPGSASSWLSNSLGRLINVKKFLSSGTYTPSLGVKKIIVEVQAAGGGSRTPELTNAPDEIAISSGSGAGAYARCLILNPVQTVVTVGASSPAVVGGSSRFGNLITCAGGLAPQVGQVSTFPFVVSSTGNTADPVIDPSVTVINACSGEGSSVGFSLAAGAYGRTGAGGGSSKLGTGGHAPTSAGNFRLPSGYGGGVSGVVYDYPPPAVPPNVAGGNGIVIVWEYS